MPARPPACSFGCRLRTYLPVPRGVGVAWPGRLRRLYGWRSAARSAGVSWTGAYAS
jgi:hypothetical protein